MPENCVQLSCLNQALSQNKLLPFVHSIDLGVLAQDPAHQAGDGHALVTRQSHLLEAEIQGYTVNACAFEKLLNMLLCF